MAVSPTPKSANNSALAGAALLPPSFQPELPLAVALSGGADSTALLWACVQRWPGQVRAVHIHHGLQDAANLFEAHCRALCEQWQVPLVVCKVNARHEAGQSPEDAARRARYLALSESVHQHPDLQGVKHIALAQHADDQVEKYSEFVNIPNNLYGAHAFSFSKNKIEEFCDYFEKPSQLPWGPDPHYVKMYKNGYKCYCPSEFIFSALSTHFKDSNFVKTEERFESFIS
jgi:hypothetical protein